MVSKMTSSFSSRYFCCHMELRPLLISEDMKITLGMEVQEHCGLHWIYHLPLEKRATSNFQHLGWYPGMPALTVLAL